MSTDGNGARREILSAAAEAFAEHGYHGMSMRDLARATGRSPAGFYNYFASKEELLYSLQRDAFDTLLDTAERAVRDVESPVARLYVFILNHVRYFAAHPAAMRVLIHEASALPPRWRNEVRLRKEEYYGIARDTVAEIMRQSRGEVSPQQADKAEVERTTYCLFGMLNWMYGWYETERHGRPEELARTIHRIALGGMAEHSAYRSLQDKMERHLARVEAPALLVLAGGRS